MADHRGRGAAAPGDSQDEAGERQSGQLAEMQAGADDGRLAVVPQITRQHQGQQLQDGAGGKPLGPLEGDPMAEAGELRQQSGDEAEEQSGAALSTSPRQMTNRRHPQHAGVAGTLTGTRSNCLASMHRAATRAISSRSRSVSDQRTACRPVASPCIDGDHISHPIPSREPGAAHLDGAAVAEVELHVPVDLLGRQSQVSLVADAVRSTSAAADGSAPASSRSVRSSGPSCCLPSIIRDACGSAWRAARSYCLSTSPPCRTVTESRTATRRPARRRLLRSRLQCPRRDHGGDDDRRREEDRPAPARP